MFNSFLFFAARFEEYLESSSPSFCLTFTFSRLLTVKLELAWGWGAGEVVFQWFQSFSFARWRETWGQWWPHDDVTVVTCTLQSS